MSGVPTESQRGGQVVGLASSLSCSQSSPALRTLAVRDCGSPFPLSALASLWPSHTGTHRLLLCDTLMSGGCWAFNRPLPEGRTLMVTTGLG